MAKKNNLLLILDGWGHREESQHNAIKQASTPNFDALIENHPTCLIKTYGIAVGLPGEQMGNSEVGHMNLGAGRVVYQTLTRINEDIKSGAFPKNKALSTLIEATQSKKSSLHIALLLSDGGVHSHISHLESLLTSVPKEIPILVHAFTDGRDTPPSIAEKYIKRAEAALEKRGNAKIASIGGRYFGMDRDARWDRVEKAYRAMTAQDSPEKSALDAISKARARDETDEFVVPFSLVKESFKEGDTLLFLNFRADRARQIARVFTDSSFNEFKTVHPKLSCIATLTSYAENTGALVLYPPQSISNHLGAYISSLGKKQLRIAETEKYAHVTFFFNCGEEEPTLGEDRILIPSPKVATYDLKPEMSAFEVVDSLEKALDEQKYDLIVCNLANGDMVGHTGIEEAAIKAAEVIDACVGRLMKSIEKNQGEMLVTADHGNCELMFDEKDNVPMTQHTVGCTYLSYFGKRKLVFNDKDGALGNVAPTMLTLMDIKIPEEMSAPSLIQSLESS